MSSNHVGLIHLGANVWQKTCKIVYAIPLMTGTTTLELILKFWTYIFRHSRPSLLNSSNLLRRQSLKAKFIKIQIYKNKTSQNILDVKYFQNKKCTFNRKNLKILWGLTPRITLECFTYYFNYLPQMLTCFLKFALRYYISDLVYS